MRVFLDVSPGSELQIQIAAQAVESAELIKPRMSKKGALFWYPLEKTAGGRGAKQKSLHTFHNEAVKQKPAPSHLGPIF